MKTRQDEDLELWREWKKTRNTTMLNRLLTRLQPLIYREVSKWQGTLPVAVLESKGRELTVKALESYSPTHGAAIGTHVTSRLRKLSRSVYPYQNVARLPENKQLKYNTFMVAQNNLYDVLGRDPTTHELADELSWSPKKVEDFNYTYARRELVESEGAAMRSADDTAVLTDFYYHGLAPDDQRLFEDLTGYGGKKALNSTQIKSKYKIPQGVLSYKKRKFVSQIKDIQQGKV